MGLKISYHGDADGISSVVLFLKGKGLDLSSPEVELYSPDTFGDVSDSPDVILDQTPKDSKWSGTCIDHHDQHPEEYDYDLIYDDIPTAGIVYKTYKDKIPKEERWKAAIGICGDMQFEKVPDEIWDSFPELTASSGWSRRSYGRIKWSDRSVWDLVKTLINAPGRLGDEETAVSILWDAKTPLDILFNDYLRDCREKVSKEMSKVEKNLKVVNLNKIVYVEYSSEMRLWLSSDLYNVTGKTTVCLNTNGGKLSVRGPRAMNLSKYLNSLGIDAGGHKGYCGGRIPTGMSAGEFRDIILAYNYGESNEEE